MQDLWGKFTPFERRWLVLEVSPKLAFQGSRSYFADFERMLTSEDNFGYKVWDFYLANLDLLGFLPSVFPTTKAMKRQVAAHLDHISNWWKNCLLSRFHVEPEHEDLMMAAEDPECAIRQEPTPSKAHKAWLNWPVRFASLYSAFLESKHAPKHNPPSQSEFSHKLRTILPPRTEMDTGSEYFEMPSLDECLAYGKRVLAMDDPPPAKKPRLLDKGPVNPLRQGRIDFAPSSLTLTIRNSSSLSPPDSPVQ